MSNLSPEVMTFLFSLVAALIGYFARHYHIEIPGLPKSPNPFVDPNAPKPVDPAAPVVTGRPLLDKLLQWVLAEISDPISQAHAKAEVNALAKVLDNRGVPNLNNLLTGVAPVQPVVSPNGVSDAKP